eukprot:gnl/Dysnectes_brevis/2339_a2758_1629.p1 GENE.gnl/Dysnectes_brevis/2339_a2758_1629~~gnl/Dysnectes_brevis/2339_a2758_1629.p1  ORF type:complete len:325 (+),score=37.78 gnl/Dysnectes_brevis/2339_a2758_1629:117-977(+)
MEKKPTQVSRPTQPSQLVLFSPLVGSPLDQLVSSPHLKVVTRLILEKILDQLITEFSHPSSSQNPQIRQKIAVFRHFKSSPNLFFFLRDALHTHLIRLISNTVSAARSTPVHSYQSDLVSKRSNFNNWYKHRPERDMLLSHSYLFCRIHSIKQVVQESHRRMSNHTHQYLQDQSVLIQSRGEAYAASAGTVQHVENALLILRQKHCALLCSERLRSDIRELSRTEIYTLSAYSAAAAKLSYRDVFRIVPGLLVFHQDHGDEDHKKYYGMLELKNALLGELLQGFPE